MNLLEMLPRAAYHDEAHVGDFQGAVGRQMDAAEAARDDLMKQACPATATWGMTIYEREYGIEPDVSKPHDQRLSRWRAKRRGQGTTTKELIKLMASSFTGGEVDVREPKGQYLVEIEFIGTWGVPPNVDDLEESIREVLPAHLDLTLLYKYLTFGMLTAQDMTFGELTALGLEWPEFAGGAWTDGR